MDKHYQTLGILYLCYAALKVALYFLGLQFLSVGMHYIVDDPEAMFLMHLGRYVIGTMIVLYTVPSIIAGFGLIARKQWAVILALIIGVISLPIFPLGTAIGVYSIVVFLMKHSSTYNPGPPNTSEQ